MTYPTDPTPAELYDQVDAFLGIYSWIWTVEQSYGLPTGLLLAVGSRETNLTNEVGDGGHGHGVWQLDDRSHVIPAGFDTNVLLQAQTAAGMLGSLLAAQGGNVDRAACGYNSGQPLDQYTTGGNYGTDVAGRLAAIQTQYAGEFLMALTDAQQSDLYTRIVGLTDDGTGPGQPDEGHTVAAILTKLEGMINTLDAIAAKLGVA